MDTVRYFCEQIHKEEKMNIRNLEGILTVDSIGPHKVKEIDSNTIKLIMPDGSSVNSRYMEYHGRLAYRFHKQQPELKPQDSCCPVEYVVGDVYND